MTIIKCSLIFTMCILRLTYQLETPSEPDIVPEETIISTTDKSAEMTPMPIKPENYPKPSLTWNPKPSFETNSRPSPQNILQKLFTQFLQPIKVSGKTYGHGPNVVAIIGDKPYISLEVFNKFSPFKWLFSAFQGKIQNVCQFFASSYPDDPNSPPSTVTVLDQLFEDNLHKPTGSKQQFQEYGSIRIFNAPLSSRNIKVKH
ncbi:uncharacterized protein LOC126738133 [Anthonomus grandis grandis]|uniref:uncharacterized protein LOC126738133 n=1 Tax=Anthonomus grandis grandis TaxID=2921223 RepID=UPI002165242E|nr:uncharacterized protein LOC126738133 [Anthonomus grandis grandis]